MSTSDASDTPASSFPGAQVIMVPVKRYDVTLTMDDIITPLTQTVANLAAATPAAQPTDPELAQHLQHFNDLVAELKDVVAHINQIDASVFVSKPGPPPSASAQPPA
jgi:hypothetical protein